MENEHVFKGCIPAIMTPCNSKGSPDFDALVRKAKKLIKAGMQSVVSVSYTHLTLPTKRIV